MEEVSWVSVPLGHVTDTWRPDDPLDDTDFGMPKGLYMPEDQEQRLQALHHLRFVRPESDWEPFTEIQYRAFSEANRKRTWAKVGLVMGGILSSTVPLISTNIGLATDWITDPGAKIAVKEVAGFVGAWSPFSSFLFGGIMTYRAAQAADASSEEFQDALRMYVGLGEELVLLARNTPDAARKVTSQLDLKRIEAVMKRTLTDRRSARLIEIIEKAKIKALSILEAPGPGPVEPVRNNPRPVAQLLIRSDSDSLV